MPEADPTPIMRRWINAGTLRAILPFVLLAVFFPTLYHRTGQRLESSPMYDRNDVFFRTDTHRALKDMTGDRMGGRGRTSVHPIFVIAHQPIGAVMTEYYRSKHLRKYDALKRASVFMTSLAGAGVVLLVFATLRAMGISLLRAFLFAAVLGCSSTQIFFSSAPETYIFSALGLAAVALVGSRRKLGELWWQAGAVYAAGNLTANLAPMGLWCLARHWRGRAGMRRMLVHVSVCMALTLILLVFFSVVQKLIYPESALFFLPSSVTKEGGWLYWDNILKTPWDTCRILLQHQWLSNIIGPEPVLQIFNGEPMVSIEQGTWSMFQPAWPLYGLWGMLLCGAATSLSRRETYTHSFVATVLCLAFNFVFHSVFGNDRMLYSADWTLYSVIAVAWGIEILIRHLPRLSHAVTALIVVFLVLEMVHNVRFLDQCAALVAPPQP